jgi:GT2 family glycosyltransferase/radical SAM superfamily enzyme YgiQ (UPF0313 family)
MPFPFFLAYAAAVLEREQHAVALVDGIAEKMSDEEFLRRVAEHRPDLVLLEISTISLDQDLAIAAAIRQRLDPDTLLAFSGLHAFMYEPAFLEQHPEIDIVLIGEYEETLRELCAALDAGAELDGIPGLLFRRADGTVAHNGRRPLIENLDALPWPARHLLPMERYHDCPGGIPAPSVQMWASRGCPYKCIFCAWPQIMYDSHRYRVRDPINVVDEFEHLVKEWGFRSVYFDDDTFNIGKRRILTICSELRRRGLQETPWAAMARADTMDLEMLEAMAEAGLRAIKYGVESATQEIVTNAGKSLDLAKVRRVVQRTRELGLHYHLTFMFGLPGETRDSARRTIDLALELDPHSLQFTIATPFPGSRFHHFLRERGMLLSDDWRKYDGFRSAVVRTEELGPEDLEEIVAEANRRWDEHCRNRPRRLLVHEQIELEQRRREEEEARRCAEEEARRRAEEEEARRRQEQEARRRAEEEARTRRREQEREREREARRAAEPPSAEHDADRPAETPAPAEAAPPAAEPAAQRAPASPARAQVAEPLPTAVVIVPSFNGRHLLEQHLPSVCAQQGIDFEVVVVDSGSEDGTPQWLARTHPDVRVIRIPENAGFAGAVNAGIKGSRSRYVALVNNDCRLEPHWLAEMCRVLDAHEDVAIAASRVMRADDPQRIDSAGDGLTRGGFSFNIGNGVPDGERFDRFREVFAACASAALYRRSLFQEIGYFDQDFFCYLEDLDLAFRARLAGYRCLYVPSARAYHVGAATTGSQYNPMTVFHIARNTVFLMVKNLPAPLLRRSVPRMIWHLLTRQLYHTLRTGQGRAHLSGLLAAYRLRHLLRRKRAEVQPAVRLAPEEIRRWLVASEATLRELRRERRRSRSATT